MPNSVAAEVNNTEYLPIGVNGLLTTVLDRLKLLQGENPPLELGGILGSDGLLDLGGVQDLGGLVELLDNVVQTIPESLDVIDLRVPIVVGFGMSAFADVDWAKVPADIFNLMVEGIEKEFFSGNPTPGTPNTITAPWTAKSLCRAKYLRKQLRCR